MSAERLFSYEQAKAIWYNQITKLNIQPRLHWQGHTGRQTAFCYLEHQGECIAKGVGKGLTQEQIELSACYEALEHCFSAHHLSKRNIILDTISNISKQYQTTVFRSLPSLLKSKSKQVLPWVIVTEYKSKESYAVPLATLDTKYPFNRLAEDKFDYCQHRLYASTNGLAASASYDEALLHAISEIIERDAISYFLLDTFLLKQSINIISQTSLPEYLQTLIKQIESLYNNKVLLIQLPSRYNVPVYCAVLTEPGEFSKIPAKGFGASLNAHYAAERAILEALQTLHVYECMPEERVNLATTATRDYPVLFDCLRFNVMELINANQFQLIDFAETSCHLMNLPLTGYLQVLIDKIYQHHPIILIDNIITSDDGFSCINVIIPGTEEFFHVFNEYIVLPQEQTKMYIQHRLRSSEKVQVS